jgi:predicted acyltransferase
MTTPFSRVASVDIYRGFVMLLMMAEVLEFRHVSESLPQSDFWRFLYYHQDHVPWVGCSLHDLIQPSFSFLVGVALPYSMASRATAGNTFGGLALHAVWRSLILILLGIFLRSMHAKQTYFTFEDTLTQIGLGYFFLFLLGYASQRVVYGAIAAILIGYFAAFALYPLPGPDFDYAAVGADPAWPHYLQGFAAHWNKNTNWAAAFEEWFLNLFPREAPFKFNEGGYLTLSFIPTLGTMLLGLIAGRTLKSEQTSMAKIKSFLLWGAGLMVGGLTVHYLGICPIVKRIWTPAWVLFSGGWCFFLLAFFYGVADVMGKARWGFFFTVLGVNSIAAYVFAHTIDRFIRQSLSIHLGSDYSSIFGMPYSTLVSGTLILLIEWLILYWMYRRRIFIKI